MKNEKMILFSDYVEDKKELENVISDLVKRFLEEYPVEVKEIALIFRPGFGEIELTFDSVEIIVK